MLFLEWLLLGMRRELLPLLLINHDDGRHRTMICKLVDPAVKFNVYPKVYRTAEKRQAILDRKGKVKALGDKPYMPSSQTIGMLSGTDLVEDIDVFVRLAKGYVFEGLEREEICSHNSEVSVTFLSLCRV